MNSSGKGPRCRLRSARTPERPSATVLDIVRAEPDSDAREAT